MAEAKIRILLRDNRKISQFPYHKLVSFYLFKPTNLTRDKSLYHIFETIIKPPTTTSPSTLSPSFFSNFRALLSPHRNGSEPIIPFPQLSTCFLSFSSSLSFFLSNPMIPTRLHCSRCLGLTRSNSTSPFLQSWIFWTFSRRSRIPHYNYFCFFIVLCSITPKGFSDECPAPELQELGSSSTRPWHSPSQVTQHQAPTRSEPHQQVGSTANRIGFDSHSPDVAN